MDPKGKVAIVTGGGSGIGRATALALASAGAAVVVADVDEEGGRETVRLVEDKGGRAAFVAVDVTRWEDLERMVAFAEETFGGLDILHNNAGVTTGRPRFPETPRQQWERALNVDLWSVIAGVQVAVPAMRRRGGGVIVNTASLAGIIGYQPDPVYCAAKHGVVGLTRSLVFLKDEANIRVNCVCPGVVDTPLVYRGLQDLEGPEAEQWRAYLQNMPKLRPEEVAEAVMTFVRDDSLAGEAMGLLPGSAPRLIPPPIQLQRDPSQRLR
ncbi:MAG: SDR family NAD(P)-dependent oxidoreductase [Chloroflexota bacterium]|jgi:NAD(P)-dependent dehydrogenase (short-subunit alcohol dehydrogenase family)|nr:SDR family NAD(P)-dependent oxidoreductase [Chloroflexota bacterium]